MNRQLDQKAWTERLNYISTIYTPKTLKDWYDSYTVTPEEEEQFKLKADEVQVGGTHYKDMGVQPWEVMQAVLTPEEFIGFLKGNIIKYSMRQGMKDSPDAGKCKHYIQKLKEVTNVVA